MKNVNMKNRHEPLHIIFLSVFRTRFYFCTNETKTIDKTNKRRRSLRNWTM